MRIMWITLKVVVEVKMDIETASQSNRAKKEKGKKKQK